MLFHLSILQEIRLLHEPVDFRKGISGLACHLYNLDYQIHKEGCLYIFYSKNRKSLKILYYGEYGFELWHKKQAVSHYKIPRNLSSDQILDKSEFKKLLLGYSILESGFPKVLGTEML